jgi:hypothetical protein
MALISFGAMSGGLAWGAGSENAGSRPGNEEREVVGPRTEKSFYGWQILATGGLGGAFVAASLALPDRPFGGGPLAMAGFTVGLPFYVFGGPAVHWTHGDLSKGLLSFGANVAIPLAAGLVSSGMSSEDPARGFARGAAVCMLIVPVVDALVLGWEDVPVELMASKRRRSISMAISPAIQMRAEGGVIWGVRGGF